jgi:hypothetical protein
MCELGKVVVMSGGWLRRGESGHVSASKVNRLRRRFERTLPLVERVVRRAAQTQYAKHTHTDQLPVKIERKKGGR